MLSAASGQSGKLALRPNRFAGCFFSAFFPEESADFLCRFCKKRAADIAFRV